MSDVMVDENTAPADQPMRDFSLFSAFALAFSDISPIVGIYSVFAISLVAAGPAFIWSLPIVLAGELLVTAVFGELVSRWPLQGSVYAWSRQLVGAKFGWWTNWIYMWGLTMTLSVLALAATGYLWSAAGVASPTATQTLVMALAVLALGSGLNMLGGKVLKTLLYVTLTCELIASLGIGIVLFFYHTRSVGMIFTTAGTGGGLGWFGNSFLATVAFAGYSFVGFEAAGAIAQEVKQARRVLPIAMILSLAACGVLVIFACLGISLAIPDLSKVMNGSIADPISTTLELRLGGGVGRAILVVLAVGFTASMIAVQTAVTRSIWSAARDGVIPGKALLGRLSGPEHLPRYAILLTGLVAGALLFISTSKLYTLLLSFANIAFYLSYAMPVLAAVYVRTKGRWTPGPFSLGPWGRPVTYIAAAWLVFECINIAWPRPANPQWYLNWGVIIMIAALGILGLATSMFMFKSGGQAAPVEGATGA